MTPSLRPTSNMPTSPPTITGSVVFIDLDKQVTSSMTNDEIEEIMSQAENAFGIYPGDVIAEVAYEVTGTVTLHTDDADYSDEELVSALQTSIAEALNVHESDVEVAIDSDTGIATYTITSQTAEDVARLQNDFLRDDILNDITVLVTDSLPAVNEVSKSSRLL